MNVTPTGIISYPVELLGRMVAASASVQTLLGVDNASDAYDAIVFFGAEEEDFTLPVIFIMYLGGAGQSQALTRDMKHDLLMEITLAVPDGYSFQDSMFLATNTMGAILAEAMENNEAGMLRILSFMPNGPPARADKKERNAGDDYVCYSVNVQAGP